ncbi:MAG: hypothetical protein PHU91_01295 [Candidatus Omnitrophica bacterium]|nr:hypothetical protein [Candidatus Omnitrophota bacterium]MDD5236296.1 hypothetical protein [Candidatus Omnitrophota bacterium]MDD5611346.1 hypothetical protein [Candidatus Omnitrophota bacterium]
MANNIIFSITTIVVYFILVHILIEFLMKYLWECIGKKRVPDRLTATLGFIDRLIYALSLALRAYTFIGIWLAVKVASRLVGYTSIAGEDKIKEEGERRNVYLIGNIFSLILGLGGGLLIKLLFDIQINNFLEFLK